MEKNDLQTHGSAMGKKMAFAFSVLQQGRDRNPQPKRTKTARYIEDIFSLWTINRHRIEQFIEQANNHHPIIKFTAEISNEETTFLRTPTSRKAQDSKETQSLMCVLLLNQLRHFNIRILVPATHKELKKASLKERPYKEQILLK